MIYKKLKSGKTVVIVPNLESIYGKTVAINKLATIKRKYENNRNKHP